MARRPRTKAASEPAGDILAQAGDVGLKISGGIVQEEYVRGLQGSKARDTWQEMLDSPLPGAVMSLVSLFAQQVEWTVEPAIEDDEAAQKVADFISENMEGMKTGWNQIVVEALSAYPFGFSLAEPLYEIRPDSTGTPRYMWRDIEPRAQSSVYRWLETDVDGRCEVTGVQQLVPTRGTFDIPLTRLIHFVPRPEKRSPEGRSAYRSGWRAWMYARNLEESEAIGIDRDLTGVPDIQLPPAVMDPNADAARRAVRADWEDKGRKLRRGKLDALVRPSEEIEGKKTGYAVKLMTSGGTQRVVADTPIRRHETRFLISVLCDFMSLGQEAVGSKALADSKITLTVAAIGGLLDSYAEAVTKQGAHRLCELNGFPKDLWPEIERGEVMAPELPELIDMLSKAINGGIIVPTQELQDWMVRQIPGAPEPDMSKDEEMRPGPALVPDPQEQVGPNTQAVGPGPVVGMPGDAKAADTALNGAQVTAAQGIVQSVVDGQLPRDTAVNMLTEFFNIDAARADRILGSVGRGFIPEADPVEPKPSASPTEQPAPPATRPGQE